MRNIILGIILAVAMSGCANTVWVREKQESNNEVTYKQIGGVPFYVKKEVWEQSTTYSQTWLKSTLSVEKKIVVTKDGKLSYFDVDRHDFNKRVVKYRLPDLYKIKEKIMQAGLLEDDEVNDIVKEFSSMPPDLDFNSIKPELIGNIVNPKWVVNEEEKYYLNAPLPWFGASNLTQEINSDGTLSKVISSPDTKLSEGLSSLIPFKEYFTGKFVNPLSDDTDAKAAEELSEVEAIAKAFPTRRLSEIKPSSKIVYFVSLSIEEAGYLYTFSETHEDLTSVTGPLSFDPYNGKFSRSLLVSEKKNEERKEEGKTVGLSGSISFPEGWGEGK